MKLFSLFLSLVPLTLNLLLSVTQLIPILVFVILLSRPLLLTLKKLCSFYVSDGQGSIPEKTFPLSVSQNLGMRLSISKTRVKPPMANLTNWKSRVHSEFGQYFCTQRDPDSVSTRLSKNGCKALNKGG